MKPSRKALFLLAALLWLLAGCVGVDGAPLTISPTPSAAAPAAEAPATTPRTVFPLVTMSDAEPLAAGEVVDQVAPALAMIETPHAAGSGILVQPGYLLTSVDVVWPATSARVRFPDGTDYEDVPVIGWDLLAGVALLGPLEEQAGALALVDGSATDVGSDVYLIGYPSSARQPRRPSSSLGSISRVHTWEPLDLTLFQVDANVTGGQRGSVLVSERGEVIGIMTIPLPDDRAALVASAADLVPRLTALLSGAGIALSDRQPLAGSAQTEHTGLLDDNLEADLYLLEVEPGTDVRLAVEGVGRPALEVIEPSGMVVAASEDEGDGRHVAAFSARPGTGLYLARVTQVSQFRNRYTLSSNHPLIAYEDPDGGLLSVGETRPAALDMPGDWDTYEIELKQGDTVAVEVDGPALDPAITLLYQGPAREDLVVDGGRGLDSVAGEPPSLVYEAPADGAYTLVVRDAGDRSLGGYFITVRAAEAGESPTEPTTSRTFFFSPFGRLEQYTSEGNEFSIKYPAYWSSVECPEGATACFQGGDEALLLIAEEEIDRLGLPDDDQGAYVDLVAELMAQQLPNSRMVSQGVIVTPQGLEGETLVFTGNNGLFTVSRFIYVNEEGVAFNATYFVPTEVYAELRPAFSYTYSTFRSWSNVERTEDPVYFLDEGAAHYAQQKYEQAEEALSRAIALDPELAEAYALRADVYLLMGEPEKAIADLEAAIALEESDNYYASLANVHWTSGANDAALAAITQAVDLEPDVESHYNTRALIYATLGDLDEALDDMERHADLVEGELQPYALDTRAYIYLKLEAYEEALADYEAALSQDFQVAHTLLGAGIVYARLGQMEQALPLLEYGMERVGDERLEQAPDPQLAELIGWAEELLEAAPSREGD